MGYRKVSVQDKKTVFSGIEFRLGMWQSKVTWISKEAVYTEAQHLC